MHYVSTALEAMIVTYTKFNIVTELRKMAKGKPTKAPAWLIADRAIPLVEAALEDYDVAELERLFGLPDTRE